MIKESISELLKGNNLAAEAMKGSVEEIMSGQAAASQIGAFLALLSAKKETVEEITQAAGVMRRHASRIELEPPVMDTCSTGGTGMNHLNISTAVAFVIAGTGIKVAKHGNRAASGKCGSADVLEKLGINLSLEPEQVKKCIQDVGVGFLFAPVFHKAMKYAAGPRKELGIRTVFNILGPLTNPASATHQLLGVFDADLTEPMAQVLGNLGVVRAMVVHGDGGLDEITLSGSTKVSELKNGQVKTYRVSSGDFGLESHAIDDIRGSDAEMNAGMMKRLFEGEKMPYRDVVLANAAASFVILGRAGDFKEGVEIAAEAIDSKETLKKLEGLIQFSNSF